MHWKIMLNICHHDKKRICKEDLTVGKGSFRDQIGNLVQMDDSKALQEGVLRKEL